MVEETRETKGKAETTKLAANLRRNGQLEREREREREREIKLALCQAFENNVT